MWEPRILTVIADINDAWMLEKIIMNQQFPKKHQKVIIFAYLKAGYDFRSQCRKIGIRPSEYDFTLLRAQQLLHNLLNNA